MTPARLLRALRRSVARIAATTRDLVACWTNAGLGPGVSVHGRPVVENRGQLHVGAGTVVFAEPAGARLATGPCGTLVVGREVRIGHGVTIAAQGLVEIGDGSSIGAFAVLADTAVGERPGRHSRTARPISIGRHVRLGTHVVVMPGTWIGDGAVVAAGAIVEGAIPPGARVCAAVASEPPNGGRAA